MRKKINGFLIVVFGLAVFIIGFLALPVVAKGNKGVFYSIDPDVVYIANSLSYIKNGAFGYYDHPGTPAIVLTSLTYAPLRLYTKYFLNQNFITWSYNVLPDLVLYSRIFQGLLFLTGLIFLIKSLYNLKRSGLDALLILATVFCYLPIYYAVTAISAETFVFAMAAIWVYFYSLFLINRKTKIYLYCMLFLSGLMIADRITGLFYLSATEILYLNSRFNKNEKKYFSLLKLISLPVIGFLVGIWPLRNNLDLIFKRLFLFAGSSGVHGAGAGKFWDTALYINSIQIFLTSHAAFSILVAATFFIGLYYIIKSKRKIEGFIGLNFVAGILIFAKFPLAHYQIANYVFIAFFVSAFLTRLNTVHKALLTLALIAIALPVGSRYLGQINDAVQKEVILENYMNKNKVSYPTVWVWARSNDFAKLWIRDWGGGIYDDDLRTDSIYELGNSFKSIRTGSSTYTDTNKICPAQFVMQSGVTKEFLLENNFKNVNIKNIEGSDNIVVVERVKCL